MSGSSCPRAVHAGCPLHQNPRDAVRACHWQQPQRPLEKTLLTYQFLTSGISPRILTYQPGFWHISDVWHISQDFGISVRILYRLPLQYKPFCTVFHCSTTSGCFHPVPGNPKSFSLLPKQKKTSVLSIHDPCRHPGVSVMSCLTRCTRATAVVLHRPNDAASFASGCAAGGALMHAGCACRHIRPSAPSATGCAATFSDDISVYKPCMESGCATRARMRHAPAAHPTQHLSTRGSARPRAYISAWSRQSRASAAHGCGAEQCDQGLRRGCILI